MAKFFPYTGFGKFEFSSKTDTKENHGQFSHGLSRFTMSSHMV